MKTKSNKKVVEAVRKLVAGAVTKAKMIEKKGVVIAKKAESVWNSTEPRREKITASVRRVASRAEKKANELARNAKQVKDDVVRGVRQGIKDAKKK